MYDFALVALLALAVLKVTDLVVQLVPQLARAELLLRFVVAVTAVVALDYSLFESFGVGVRDTWVGSLFTGLMIGALASGWRAVLGFLSPAERVSAEPTAT
ncbi:MAG: hypothetical protein M3179_14260, partial [Actinomycetota bacterium]|nr:hypothetical protein [Actinomycetota bacterium]